MPSPGDTICGEIVLERLAPSSLGADVFQPVFIARDQMRDESLWLTVVDGAFVPSSVRVSTFMAGANGLVGIRHPSLVRAVLVDREEDYCVVGYERLPGAEALGDLIVRGGARRVMARAAVEVARGLAYLHRRELLHGALTPGTVVLWEGVPVLWEYGLAALCEPGTIGPRADSPSGDVVAPELTRGSPPSPASDVYAWGAVMAAIASGALGSDAVAAVLGGDVDPGRHGPLLGVVRQSLSEHPGQRPRDGVELLEQLQRALASVEPDPGLESADAGASADQGALRELAERYLAEMESLQSPSASKTAAAGPSGAPASAPKTPSGSLGRVALVKRSARDLSGPKSSDPSPASATPVASSVPVESSGPMPVIGPPAPEPDWSHRLPSSAVAEVPKTEGPGLVRGPEPGVSGADAGQLASSPLQASDSSARWVSRSPETSASGWLRPAPAPVGVGGLFDERPALRELADGVRKRSILRPGSVPSLPSGAPPTKTGVGVPVAMGEEDETPPEPHDLGGATPSPEDSMRGRLALDEMLDDDRPPSERETPPDVEVYTPAKVAAREASSSELPPTPDPDDPDAMELPPMIGSELPPAAGAEADARPARSQPREPFRVPRGPGPHGPSALAMALGLSVLAGVLALATTLSASSTRGGLANLFGGGGEPGPSSPPEGDDGPSPATSGGAVAGVADAAPCPEQMVEIRQGDGGYCIDRAEYPGVDRIPAIEVDLPHAKSACESRGHALCTDAQWSRACRGTSGWRYPYGPRRESGRCRVDDPDARPGPSGADPHCVTPEGVLDMVGNVAEWTAEGVVMGGSVRSKKNTGCGSRQRLKRSTKRPFVGFRCCAERIVAVEPED